MQKSSSPFEHRELPRPRDGWRELLLRQLLAVHVFRISGTTGQFKPYSAFPNCYIRNEAVSTFPLSGSLN